MRIGPDNSPGVVLELGVGLVCIVPSLSQTWHCAHVSDTFILNELLSTSPFTSSAKSLKHNS